MILRNSLLAVAILLTPLESLARVLPPAGPDQTDRHSLNAAVLDQKPQSTGTAAELQAKVDKLFAAWDKPDTPGAALAVVRDGTVIYKRGYGIANLEYGIPITPATIFHVASVSKQFTAFAITLLAQQGKLKFDDDIRKYLPEVPDFGKTITINHLLHHTSGLRDQWELLAMAGWRRSQAGQRARLRSPPTGRICRDLLQR
jgi:CubicO group peptidase (beta-lactamase class C family)